MATYSSLEEYLDSLSNEAIAYYKKVKSVINGIPLPIKERLFAGQVAFYLEEHLQRTFHRSPVIMMAFYKDHVNIFASANTTYKKRLPQYKFTSKDTLQLYFDKPIDPILHQLFADSL